MKLVFNSNLAYATRLFTDILLRTREINILRRFDGVETLKNQSLFIRQSKKT